MKQRTITITCLVAVLTMTVFVIRAGAQDKTTKKQVMGCCSGCWMSTGMGRVSGTEAEPNAQPTKGSAGWMCTCPWCTMARPTKDAEAKGVNTQQSMMCMDMMKKMGMSDSMMMRCGMMMRASVTQTDPTGILALKEELKLTQDQINKIESIAEAARKQAEVILTENQKQTLKTVAETPDTMMGMHQWMMPKMMKEKGNWMCPWMQTPSESNDVQAKSSVQMTCPVMGGPIKKDIYTEYKGKKVYFCCPMCKGKFEANPEKYLDKLPQFK